MASSRTGKLRLRAGVPDGWHIAHNTGTGQELGARATGFNDVKLITSPDGRSHVVAVMIADTTETIRKRQQLIAEVARRVIAFDKTSRRQRLAFRNRSARRTAQPDLIPPVARTAKRRNDGQAFASRASGGSSRCS